MNSAISAWFSALNHQGTHPVVHYPTGSLLKKTCNKKAAFFFVFFPVFFLIFFPVFCGDWLNKTLRGSQCKAHSNPQIALWICTSLYHWFPCMRIHWNPMDSVGSKACGAAWAVALVLLQTMSPELISNVTAEFNWGLNVFYQNHWLVCCCVSMEVSEKLRVPYIIRNWTIEFQEWNIVKPMVLGIAILGPPPNMLMLLSMFWYGLCVIFLNEQQNIGLDRWWLVDVFFSVGMPAEVNQLRFPNIWELNTI